MNYTSLIPPFLVFFTALITKRLPLSLGCGIISALLIAMHGDFLASFHLLAEHVLTTSEIKTLFSNSFYQADKPFILLFLIFIGALTLLINHCGGAFAYNRLIKKYIRTKKGAETSSLLLSFLFCIDDYFSSITVGSVMRSVSDQYRIPRIKLAYLVNSMAAPVAIISPISSWIAALIGFFKDNGFSTEVLSSSLITTSPLIAYCYVLPFIFYSFITIISSWFIVRCGISFGLINHHETLANSTGNVHGGRNVTHEELNVPEKNQASAHLIDFIFPIIALIIRLFCCIMLFGESSLFGGTRTALEALEHTYPSYALFIASMLAFFDSSLFFLLRKRVTLKELATILKEGFLLMKSALIMLFLAWTFGAILRTNLHTGEYIASLVTSMHLFTLLPVLFFLISTFICLTIGSAWGTIAILFPLTINLVISVSNKQVPLPLNDVPLLLPTLGAVLSGAVAGNHISPLSDTNIMASTSTRAYHLDVIKAQIPYALPAIIATACSYGFAGYLLEKPWYINSLFACTIGAFVCCLLLTVLHRLHLRSGK